MVPLVLLVVLLQEIYYFHQAIRSALHSFAAEARALRATEGRVTTAQVRGCGVCKLTGRAGLGRRRSWLFAATYILS
jgi:hypothetical protein